MTSDPNLSHQGLRVAELVKSGEQQKSVDRACTRRL